MTKLELLEKGDNTWYEAMFGVYSNKPFIKECFPFTHVWNYWYGGIVRHRACSKCGLLGSNWVNGGWNREGYTNPNRVMSHVFKGSFTRWYLKHNFNIDGEFKKWTRLGYGSWFDITRISVDVDYIQKNVLENVEEVN